MIVKTTEVLNLLAQAERRNIDWTIYSCNEGGYYIHFEDEYGAYHTLHYLILE